MQNRSYQIIAIFTLAQLLILSVFGYTPYPDSDGYLFLAKESLSYGEPYPVTALLNSYHFLWNIGSVNAVVLTLKLFHSIVPLLIIYSLMKGATAWLLWKYTQHLFNDKTAFIALVLYVIYPANYGEGTSLLSELPFMFFTMLGLWLCLVRQQYLLGGMSMAFANWFRPMGIVFLVSMIIYLLFAHRHSFKSIICKKTIKTVVTPLAGYLLMIVVIGGLSYQRTGLFLFQAKTGWMALTDYSTHHSPQSLAVRDHKEWNVAQKDSVWQSLFIEWVKDHPVEYAKQMPIKLGNTYISDNVNMCTFIPEKSRKEYMYEEVSMPTLLHSFPCYSGVQWLTIINLTVYLLLLVGALCSLRYFKRESCLLPLSVIILGTLLLLLVGHGEARFHIPFMPFFLMLTALFIERKLWKG